MLIFHGFTHGEARELSRISRKGSRSPYMRKMIMQRRMLVFNAKRQGWSKAELERRRLWLYEKNHALVNGKPNVWKLLRSHQKETPIGDYVSPWRKRKRRKFSGTKSKPETRINQLKQWISGLDKSIDKARTPMERRQFVTQRHRLQNQLNKLEGKK